MSKCVFSGPSAKQQALFGAEGTMVFLFKTSTSESLSELRKARVKKDRGGERKARVHKSNLLESWMWLFPLLSSEQSAVWAGFFYTVTF